MIELFNYSFSYSDAAMFAAVAILIGMAKTGISGAGMVAVPLLAIVFGGKASTGVLLPLLIMADFFGVYHYHQHANWHHLKRLLPLALIGVALGTLLGSYIDESAFRGLMAIIIFVSLGIMIWQEISSQPNVPNSLWFVIVIGITGGIATMVGNLAGSIMALYLLAMRFPKNQFIGTAAWFFLSINLLKLPFHIFVWKTLNLNTVLLDLCLLPAIAIGAYIGIRIVSIIPEKAFRYFIITMTGIAAIVMLA